MFRFFKKLVSEKSVCPVCETQTFFHDNLDYGGMDASAILGPLGNITCATCKEVLLTASASQQGCLFPMPGLFFPGPKTKGLTAEQARMILEVAV